ncbi:MAG TPA: hypothetical protein DD979_05195 [Gammaproteobacteria bacterium]|nr:hypothetical protein [Gammaproteobacteria bacterium]
MNHHVKAKFNSYPGHIQPLMHELRSILFSVAEDLALGRVSESLKWGDPRYSVKDGSSVRIGWKEQCPDQYFLIFHCQTRLVATFRELYSDVLDFEGNRAIVLRVDSELPEQAIRHCIELAMLYKRIKHLPMLGV